MATVMAEHVPLGVERIADMILRPHFDPRELEREKDVVLQELGEARDTPGDIIFDDLQSAAFANQPLGRSILGDEASIAAITVEDLHGWRSRSEEHTYALQSLMRNSYAVTCLKKKNRKVQSL